MPTQFARYKQLNIQPSNAFYSVSFQSNLTADNKLQITLNCDYPNAKIKYSINGKERVYTTPFILNESAEITASAFEKGEKLGKSSSKSYIVSKLTGANYSLNVKNTGYNGGNVFPLTRITSYNVCYTKLLRAQLSAHQLDGIFSATRNSLKTPIYSRKKFRLTAYMP